MVLESLHVRLYILLALAKLYNSHVIVVISNHKPFRSKRNYTLVLARLCIIFAIMSTFQARVVGCTLAGHLHMCASSLGIYMQLWKKMSVRGTGGCTYTELFYATIPELFSYFFFSQFCYPYIFNAFSTRFFLSFFRTQNAH